MKLIKITIGILYLILASTSHAQSAGSHGGNFTEIELKKMLKNLVPYLSSEDGQNLFKDDIENYNRTHNHHVTMLGITDIANTLDPTIVHHKLYVINPTTTKSEERDCISGMNNAGRYFKCNGDNLPALPKSNGTDSVKSNYYGDMYRLALHEVFVQVGLEDQFEKEIPSNYPLASKLNVHLELYPEWKPGVENPYHATLTIESEKIIRAEIEGVVMSGYRPHGASDIASSPVLEIRLSGTSSDQSRFQSTYRIYFEGDEYMKASILKKIIESGAGVNIYVAESAQLHTNGSDFSSHTQSLFFWQDSVKSSVPLQEFLENFSTDIYSYCSVKDQEDLKARGVGSINRISKKIEDSKVFQEEYNMNYTDSKDFCLNRYFKTHINH